MSKKRMNVTKHALDAYLRRVQKITNDRERQSSLATDRDRHEENILKLFEYSDLIYSGQLGGRKTNASYFLNGHTAIVTDESNIITIYNIEYPFPEEAIESIISSLTKSIKEYDLKIEETAISLREKKEELDLQIEFNEGILKQKELEIEEIKREIDALKSKRSCVINENHANIAKRDNDAMQLFGNTELKVVK